MTIVIVSSDTVLACLGQKRSELGGQAVNQFRMSLRRSKSDLLDLYIRPHLLSEGQSYIYVAEDNHGKGGRPNFDPLNSRKAVEAPLGDDWALPGRWGLFANPLRWIDVGLP